MKRTEIKQILHSELCASYCKKCHYDFYEDACKYCHKNQLLEWIMDVCGVESSLEQFRAVKFTPSKRSHYELDSERIMQMDAERKEHGRTT